MLLEEFHRNGADRLPPETELASELGVSRNTLREVLAQLESEGLIQRKRRVGTVITMGDGAPESDTATKPAYPLDRIVSIPDFLATAGGQHEVEWVTVRQQTAPTHVSSALDIPSDTEVFHIRRKYTKDGDGVALGEHWIPRVLGGQAVHIEGLTVGVSTYLEESQHIEIGRVAHTVSAVAATPQIARDLGIASGSPVLVVSALLETTDGEETHAVAVGQLTFNPQIVSLSAVAHLVEPVTS